MKGAIIFLIGFVGVTFAAPSDFHKIVGGNVVNKGDHPHQIHLARTISYFGLFNYTAFGCGGSIISPKWVLTAAHCVGKSDPVLPLVRVGQHDTSVQEPHAKNYEVVRVIIHEAYNAPTFQNDIALLEIKDSIEFNEHVAAIALPASGFVPAHGSEVVVSGWGETIGNGRMSNPFQGKAQSPVLKAASVHVVSKEQCNGPSSYAGRIFDGMLCAGKDGEDSCQGDSGGPLIQAKDEAERTLVGVVSWGYGCAAKNYPGVYTNVGSYVSWINQHTGL